MWYSLNAIFQTPQTFGVGGQKEGGGKEGMVFWAGGQMHVCIHDHARTPIACTSGVVNARDNTRTSGPVNARDARGDVCACGATNTCDACNAPASGAVHAHADTSTGQHSHGLEANRPSPLMDHSPQIGDPCHVQ